VVFKDINHNGALDKDEPGIAGAELYTLNGDFITTRVDGFYDLTCEQVENHNLATNFILKLNQNSLPSGYLVRTKNNLEIGSGGSGPLKFDYPVYAPREVHLNLRGDAFRQNSAQLLSKWQLKMQTLLDELGSGPAHLKTKYLSRTDPFVLAQSRTESFRKMIKTLWDQRKNGRKILIEAVIEGKMLEEEK
jgi:large repetitive protein